MSHRSIAALAATGVAAATTALLPSAAAEVPPVLPTVSWPTDLSELPTMALLGEDGPPIPLKNAAMIDRTAIGYRYRAGQQDSRLVVKVVEGRLRFADRRTRELRAFPSSCEQLTPRRGIAALCDIPLWVSEQTPAFLEIWPRLGDDYVDGSTLPASFRMWVLADAGDDVIRTGAGDDFVNGAQDDDTVWGGDGDDWIRTGIGNDVLHGEGGDDKLIGTDGRDRVFGGPGNDSLYGGRGRDLLDGGDGADRLSCGGGSRDSFLADRSDRVLLCEVNRS